MKKRILAVAVSLMLVLSLASGCQKTTTTTSSNPNAKITISVGMWPDPTDKDNVAMFQGFQKTFEAKYPNVTVKPDHYAYAVDTFAAAANAGTAPNVFETWYTEPQKLIKEGLVANITTEVQAIGWDKYMNADIKKLMSDSSGQIYGIPRDAYVLGLMLNLNLFSAAKLTNADGTAQYPKTFDELEQDAIKIKAATGKAGFCLLAKDGSGGWHFSNIAWNFGASLETEDANGNYTANFGSAQAVAAMTFVQKLKWTDNVLTADPTQVDWAGGFVQLGTGNAAMVIAANDAVAQPTTTNGLPVSDLALVPMPAGPGGQYGLMGGTPYMFSKQSTPAQITACLNWIVTIGKSPEVSDDSKAAMEQTDANNKKAGTPNIYPVDAWTNPDLVSAERAAVDDNANVNMADYNDYFTFINTTGSRHIEEPDDTQDMYSALTNVLQTVVTTKGADVQSLMDKASSDFNAKLASLS